MFAVNFSFNTGSFKTFLIIDYFKSRQGDANIKSPQLERAY